MWPPLPWLHDGWDELPYSWILDFGHVIFFCPWAISQYDMSRVLKCACMIEFAPYTSLIANASAAWTPEWGTCSKSEPDLQLRAKFCQAQSISAKYQPTHRSVSEKNKHFFLWIIEVLMWLVMQQYCDNSWLIHPPPHGFIIPLE